MSDRPLVERIEDRRDRQEKRQELADPDAEFAEREVDGERPDGLAFADDNVDVAAGTDGELVEQQRPVPSVGEQGTRLRMVGVGIGLNMRKGPGSGYDLVVQVPVGEELLDGGALTGEWAFARYGRHEGWVQVRFVEAFDPEAQGEAEALDTADVTEVDADLTGPPPADYRVSEEVIGVNVRQGPDASAKLLVGLPAGTELVATGNTTIGWVEVRFEEITGWVAVRYLVPLGASDNGGGNEVG